jgi:hypothetical protein
MHVSKIATPATTPSASASASASVPASTFSVSHAEEVEAARPQHSLNQTQSQTHSQSALYQERERVQDNCTWQLVWTVYSVLESVDLDKTLTSNLRELRSQVLCLYASMLKCYYNGIYRHC